MTEIDDIFERFEVLLSTLEGRSYPKPFGIQIDTDLHTQRLIERLKAEIIFQTKMAERAEAKAVHWESILLERDFEDLKTGKRIQAGSAEKQNADHLLALLRRILSRKFHPDITGNTNPMQDINRALDFLEDPQTRRL